MTLRRTTDRPEQRYTLAFLGDGSDEHERDAGQAGIELTYDDGVAGYDVGPAFGRLALGMPDVAAVGDSVRSAGGQVRRADGPVKGDSTCIAFVQDPDGYKIELIRMPG